MEGQPFLDMPNNIVFALNIDWFNPFEHIQYSIGAIYKECNIQGVGEKTPFLSDCSLGQMSLHINPFLTDELLLLWKGVPLPTETQTSHVHAALLCLISDIPATRKVCGFPGLRAKLGCLKCLKVFPCDGFGEPTDYSGYECHKWRLQAKEHLQLLKHVKMANMQTERQEKQRIHGVLWSELCRLPYFDVVKNHVIDPMHNFYLGTANHVIKVWKKKGLIQQEHLNIIQSRIDEVKCAIWCWKNTLQSRLQFLWTNCRSMAKLDKHLFPVCSS